MASLSNKEICVALACTTLLCLLFIHANTTEFLVGDSTGWEVPPSSDPDIYNQWAQKKRFKVDDTLEFQYKKDSVMLVTEPEYEKCKSSEPIYFSNKGDAHISLNRSGLFYFISGVTGHCERGQKMIVKVLDVQTPPAGDQPSPPTTDQGDSSDDLIKKKNGAPQIKFMGFSNMILMIAIVGIIVMLV